MIIISLITAAVTGNMDATVNAVFEGAQSAVSTLISFAGAMCFFTGLMNIAKKSGVSDFIARLLSPVVSFLFPDASDKAKEYIAMNITANILGMGNAATPMGMLAAKTLDEENETPEIPSFNMCMLVVLNTTSFQLVPTTIIALRAAALSHSPTSVILPIWLTSAFAVVMGTASVKLMQKMHRRPMID